MYRTDRGTLITNNPDVRQKYSGRITICFMPSYEEVLLRTRDLVYDRHILLTHPQASSLKPNQTPYRTVLVYPLDGSGYKDNVDSIMLIEKCIETYYQWQRTAPSPDHYDERTDRDFRTIDLSVTDAFMERMD